MKGTTNVLLLPSPALCRGRPMRLAVPGSQQPECTEGQAQNLLDCCSGLGWVVMTELLFGSPSFHTHGGHTLSFLE